MPFSECSRMNAKFQTMIDNSMVQMTSRCQDDGSFDPLQCMGDGSCTCVKRYYGTPERNGEDDDHDDDHAIVYNSNVTDFEDIPCCKNGYYLIEGKGETK